MQDHFVFHSLRADFSRQSVGLSIGGSSAAEYIDRILLDCASILVPLKREWISGGET
jgi:hypothetical protein